MLRINGFIWIDEIVEKLWLKHHITPQEVEEAFRNKAWFKKGPKSHRPGERTYYCFGKSRGGRFIFSFFIPKPGQQALVISARDMTKSEKRLYEKQKRIS